MTKFLIATVLVIISGYGLFEAMPLIEGPSLSLTSPAEGQDFLGGITTISGSAERVAMLTLNGAPLLHDERGGFSTTLTLPHGGSILTLTATDRFGRSVTTRRDVFVP